MMDPRVQAVAWKWTKFRMDNTVRILKQGQKYGTSVHITVVVLKWGLSMRLDLEYKHYC